MGIIELFEKLQSVKQALRVFGYDNVYLSANMFIESSDGDYTASWKCDTVLDISDMLLEEVEQDWAQVLYTELNQNKLQLNMDDKSYEFKSDKIKIIFALIIE